MRLAVLTSLSLSLSVASVALAKQPVPAPPATDANVAPKAPESTDPMLLPPPPAPHTLGSWREALTMIDSHDVDLGAAVADVERARGLRRQALGAALPQIVATGAVTLQLLRTDVTTVDPLTHASTTTTEPPSPQLDAAITLTQPILAPRAWYAIGTADKAIEVAKLSVDDARRRLVGTVADAIVGVVSAEEVAEIDRAELGSALDRLALTRRGAELGAGANIDIVRFEQDVTSARQAVIDGNEALLQAREQLGLALGTSEPYGVAHDIDLDDIETSAGKTCHATKLEDRADLRALHEKKLISLRAVTDVDLEYLPTAEISTTLAASSEPLVGDDGHAAWNVMGVITVPIWDGGVRYGERRAAKADVTQATLDIENAERQARVDVDRSDRGVAVAEKAFALAEKALDQATQIKRLVDVAFQEGTANAFDVVDASTKMRQAELALAGRELEVTRARIAALLTSAKCSY